MAPRSVVAILCAVVLAGCVQDPGEPDEPDLTDSVFGPASGLASEPGDRSLIEPPSLALGEWWRYEIHLDNWEQSAEMTVVVVGATEDRFLLGHAVEDDAVPSLTIHAPALGEVTQSDLSYDAHDTPFKLLDFPLTEGRTWDGTWYGGDRIEGTVTEVDGAVATLHVRGPDPFSDVGIRYNASTGSISEYAMRTKAGERFAGFTLLEHGFGYDGVVRVPLAMDLVLCHGRIAVAVSVCAPHEPAPPAGEVEVQGPYDRGSFALILNAGWMEGENARSGFVDVSATDPTGQLYEETLRPGVPGRLLPFEVEEPDGTWTYEVTASGGGPLSDGEVFDGGPLSDGVVFDGSNAPAHGLLEGVAYRIADVKMPSGCLLSAPVDGWPGQPCSEAG